MGGVHAGSWAVRNAVVCSRCDSPLFRLVPGIIDREKEVSFAATVSFLCFVDEEKLV